MKRIFTLALLFFVSINLIAQNRNFESKRNAIEVISADNKTTLLKLQSPSYYLEEVVTPRGVSHIVRAPKGSQIVQEGAPDLPKFTASILIPDLSEMEVVVLKSEYIEIEDINITPSKGHIYRHTNPEEVPYSYGDIYEKDAFFPAQRASLDDPYIIRDYSGQALQIYPFRYNPKQKTLRIYTHLTVEVREKSPYRSINPLYRTKPMEGVVREFKNIYKRHFINYNHIEKSQAEPVKEYGRMLVISHTHYMNAMEPFMEWKNTIGIPTRMVDVSTIGGTNHNQVKAYIQAYYDTTDLAFILLVGDDMHIAPFPNSTPGITGPSDNAYSYLAGNDNYPDVLIGRFSAQSVTHVETQVERTIAYESVSNLASGWYNVAMGVARNEGAGIGHNGESDCQHMDIIRNKLLTYDYVTVHQDYDYNCTGVPNTNTSQISARINAGVSLINYCNHGSTTGWSVAGYNSTHVNALTNTDSWPFIWSVACVNGNFVNQTCFAEVWLRATHNSKPSGALATLMSTINQAWLPPMDAQDEFNDILIESYPNKIKRTFGGISFNGMYLMNDLNGPVGFETTDTWTLFGDPSVVVRTDEPVALNATHPTTILIQETNMIVNSNVNGAYVALSINGELIGTGSIVNGTAQIQFNQLINTDSITVAVTAFNHIPYIGKVEVIDFMYDYDASIFSIINPENHYKCDSINVSPKVILRNYGVNTLNNVTINYRLNNDPVQQYAWTGSLLSLETDTIVLPSFMLQEGAHTYEVFTSQPNGVSDQNPTNDNKTLSFIVEKLPVVSGFSADLTVFCNTPASVSFSNLSQNSSSYLWDFGDGHTSTEVNPNHTYDSLGFYTVSLIADAGVCGQDVKTQTAFVTVGLDMPQTAPAYSCGPGYVSLTASGQGTINWYDDATLTQHVHTGDTFVTPFLNSSTYYYVRDEVLHATQYGGKPDNAGSGGYFGNAQHQHGLLFDAYVPFKLKSVKVYAASAGTRSISLRDSNDNVLQTIALNIPAGESRITLNFDIPIGTNLKLQGDGSPNLYRNNNNAATFPYTVTGIFSITETTASLPPYNSNGNYYYFYDWEVKEEDCLSPVQAVKADIIYDAAANFSYDVNGVVVDFTNLSVNGDSFYWSFGDGHSSTDENPTHVYSGIGNYDVIFIVSNNCSADTIQTTVTTFNAPPSAAFSADNTVIAEGDTVNFYDQSVNFPDSWSWSFQGGVPSTSTQQSPSVRYNIAGTFYVSLTVSNNMGSDYTHQSSYITVLTTSIDEQKNKTASGKIYPNPSLYGYTNLLLQLQHHEVVNVEIYNTLGALLSKPINNLKLEKGSHSFRISLEDLSAGMYYFVIKTDRHQFTKKLIVSP